MRDYKHHSPFETAEELESRLHREDRQDKSLVRAFLSAIVAVAAIGVMMISCTDGIVKQAEIDEAESRGRMALMQQVQDNIEQEEETMKVFMMYASKPRSSGLYHAVLMRGAECRQ